MINGINDSPYLLKELCQELKVGAHNWT
ncbi:hypothetical protein METHB2_40012 [Candidatus Methylobacter favarea]|uniref:Uncharacterized protein n=1 Tax=Candidatus Methylobacter favarea TaxID=2707345 RepID=A0A8S0XT51_9GAMM|nr:hypothetical protein METHB2_40012 [Candidatus Methylobacter favarea]